MHPTFLDERPWWSAIGTFPRHHQMPRAPVANMLPFQDPSKQAALLSILNMFDSGVSYLVEGSNIDRPRNAITLTADLHEDFGAGEGRGQWLNQTSKCPSIAQTLDAGSGAGRCRTA